LLNTHLGQTWHTLVHVQSGAHFSVMITSQQLYQTAQKLTHWTKCNISTTV